MFKSINPYTNEIIAEFSADSDIQNKIEKSDAAFSYLNAKPIEYRLQLIELFAQKLEDKTDVFAKIISMEMGKTVREAIAEISKCVTTTRYYTQHADKYLEPVLLSTNYHKSYYTFEPTGGILAIMPWNFPFWQALRFAVPNLILGNTVLLKHAPNVLWSAKNLEDTFLEAGFPEGAFQCVNVEVDEVEKIIAHPKVKGVTLTGSGTAGASVASLAGKYLKKSVLELGGSDPYIVLNDADIDLAAKTAVQSRYQNAGQTCIAAKRWIVEEGVYDLFKTKVLSELQNLETGDPLKATTTTGPVARPDLADKIEKQTRLLIKKGAVNLTVWERENCLITPQLLEVSASISAEFTEELFGPIGMLLKAKSENDAIALGNETTYGLGSSLWTSDIEKGEALMRKINAGAVFLNGMVKSEGAIPFGGINQSGYGRELGPYGIHEFANVKSYAISR